MDPIFAMNFSPGTLLVLGIIGLLLFGKDLPLIARKLATEYFRYKKMINEATSDIRSELESAANQLEEEKRRLQMAAEATVPSINDITADTPDTPASSESDTSSADTPANTIDAPRSAPSDVPSKPAADPLSLDVPAPSSLSHRSTEPAKSPAAQLAALDTLQKGVPAPSKIPPPL